MRQLVAGVAAVLGAVVLLPPGLAEARWTAGGSGAPTVAATTMRNVSAPGATCLNFGGQRIGVTWTASPDNWVISYRVKRTGNAPGANLTLPDVAYGTNFVLDTPPRANVGDWYTYTVQSVRNNWITPPVTAPTRTYTTAGQPCA
jgi:hypothetical protein